MELDHVLIAISDLEAATRELEQRHGLAAVEGGRHQGLGTANAIVPLGGTYLELVAVVDEAEAARSGFGSWVAAGDLPRLLGWYVRTDDLDSVADRLDLTWGRGTPYPGQALAQPASIDELRLQGDPRQIAQWVGDSDVPISVREGRPELQSVVLDKAILDPALWA